MSLIEDIKKPFNIIMLAITLIAIVLSIIFYVSSIKKKEPVYSISETQLQIFNSNLSNDNISVFDKRGNQIKENIYVTTVTFWNDGQLGIDSSDVRKPITIKLTNEAKLIDYKIIKAIHPEIAHYSLLTDTANQNEEIILNWSYLDAGFGVEIQIMYSNQSESSIKVDGYISEAGIKELIISKSFKMDFWSALSLIFPAVLFFLMFKFLVEKIKKANYSFKKEIFLVSFILLILGSITFLLSIGLLILRNNLSMSGYPF